MNYEQGLEILEVETLRARTSEIAVKKQSQDAILRHSGIAKIAKIKKSSYR